MAKQRKIINTSSGPSDKLTGFLLGLIVALSLLYVSMEFTTGFSADDADELFDDSFSDMDLPPLEKHDDMIQVPSRPTPPPPAVTEKIKTVEHAEDTPDKLSPNTSKHLDGTGEAEQPRAKIDEVVPSVPINEEEPIDIRIVQQIPEFPGGMSAFVKWLNSNIRYPAAAQKQKIQGKVVVSFIINKDGSISDMKLEKSVHPLLDREALRVLRMMPRWKPGMQDNKPCRTLFAVPIVFQL